MKKTNKIIAILSTFLLIYSILLPGLQVFAQNEKSDPSGDIFKDIKNHWAKEPIKELEELGIINGYEDGTFRPKEGVTRAHFVAMLVRLMGYENHNLVPVFTDVEKEHWAFNAVQAAVEQGIILQKDYNKNFFPTQQLTRQEMSIMMGRTLKLTALKDSALPFKDQAKITEEKGLIATTVKEGLIVGFEDNTFRPASTSTRGQAAAILIRLYNFGLTSNDPNVPTPLPKRNSKDEVTLLETVTEMPENIMNLLETVKDGDSTFIFSKSTTELTNLKKGDIFVLPPSKEYPTGFAEKVKTITESNGKITITTEDPEITEVFKKIDIQEETDVNFDNLIPIDIPEGVSFKPVNGSVSQPGHENNYRMAASKGDFILQLKELKLDVKGHDVKVSGDITFTDTKLVIDVEYMDKREKKVNSVGAYLYTNSDITVNVSIPGEIASAKVEGNYSNVFKGLGLEAKGGIPSWMKKTDSTEPFEYRKSMGTFFLPVYGPAGANLEAFFVLKADLSVGIEVKIEERVNLKVGVLAKKGNPLPIPVLKPSYQMPKVTITGGGGIQAKAGGGLGVKLSIYRLSIGGIEAEAGLKGEVYARALAGTGDSKDTKNENESLQLQACYRAGIGGYVEAQITLDILKKLGFKKASLKIMDDFSKPFAEITNCSDENLVTNPSLVILSAGESQKIGLEYFSYDREELDLKNETGDIKKEDIKYELKGSKDIKVTQESSGSGHSFKVEAAKDALGGEAAELEIIYKKDKKEIKRAVKIFVTSFEDIEVSPNSLVLDSNESRQLKTKAKLKQINGIDSKELSDAGVKLDDLLKKEIENKNEITFKSLDNNVATVSSTGVVQAKDLVQEASTTIEITYRGKKASVPVTVRSKAYSNNGGNSGGGNPVNQRLEMFRLIILESEKHASATFKPEADSNRPADFADLKPLLADFYTDNYLDGYWKKVYTNNIKWFLDPHLLYPLTEATKEGIGSTFRLTSDSEEKVKASVTVPLRENEIKNDRFTYEYTLIREDDRWKLDNIACLNCERPE